MGLGADVPRAGRWEGVTAARRYITAAQHDKRLRDHNGEWPVGPNGWPLCRECGSEIPRGARRRRFCSERCSTTFMVRSSPTWAREAVERRDRGVCAVCGSDAEKLRRIIRHVSHTYRREIARLLGVNGIGLFAGDYWQADHITPVCLGGGACDLENLRTLCTECHKSETRRLAHERAEARRAARSTCGEHRPK
jgi:5-methylcytosine-specific restriction endonuclease McrA